MTTHRRRFIAASVASATALVTPQPLFSTASAESSSTKSLPVKFALNTSTIRGQKLSIEQQIDVVADAGYDGIEPWIRDLRDFVQRGGDTKDLRKRLEDAGLSVVSAIGFAKWIVDDEAQRNAGLEEARRDMELVRSIGGDAIAAPPIGAHKSDSKSPPLDVIASRFRTLCELGGSIGVAPQLELWGFSPTLHRLGELAYVAAEAAHPMAYVLPDFYHIYKGGNDFESLVMIEASRMKCFHINDYPASPGLETISDKDRVFPGDGTCELPTIIRGLIDRGFAGSFSLELFNPEYWKRDALQVASEGLLKSKRVVEAAMSI